MKGSPITEQLHEYIVETFAPDDAVLAESGTALGILRPGGVLVVDNAAAGGDVWQKEPATDAARIHAIREMNRRIAEHPLLSALLVPISNGMVVAVKHSASGV